MAPTGGTFSQRISLDGGAELIRQLEEIGQAGAKAFKQLQDSANGLQLQRLTQQLGAVSKELTTLGGHLGSLATRLGAVFGVTLGAGAGGLAASLLLISKNAISAGSEIGTLAKQTGTSVEEMSGLVEAAKSFGVSTDDLGTAFKRLAVNAQEAWPEIKKQIRDSADAAKTAQINFEAAKLKVVSSEGAITQALINSGKAEIDLAFASRTATQQRITNALSVRGAVLSLEEAEERLRIVQGGEADPQLAQELAEKRAILAVDEARARVAQARKKQEEDAQKAALEAQEVEQRAILAAQQLKTAKLQAAAAEVALRQAATATSDQQKNDIVNLKNFVNDLASGAPADFEKVEASAENLKRGIIASVGAAGGALKDFTGDIGQLVGTDPQLVALTRKIADVFKNLNDESKKTAIGVSFFGRAVDQSFIKFLSGGSDAIDKAIEKVQKLGLALTEADVDADKAFKKADRTLGNTIDSIKTKVGALFAPLGTDIAEAITDRLREAIPAIKGFFNNIKDNVQPFVTAIANIIKGISFEDFLKTAAGKNLDPKQQLSVLLWQETLDDLKGRVIQFGRDVISFFETVFIPAFDGVRAALQTVADLINRFRGTQLTGDQLGVLALIGHFTGLNGIIGDVIKSLATLGAALLILGVRAAPLGLALLPLATIATAFAIGWVGAGIALDAYAAKQKKVVEEALTDAARLEDAFAQLAENTAGSLSKENINKITKPASDFKDNSRDEEERKRQAALKATGDAAAAAAARVDDAANKMGAGLDKVKTKAERVKEAFDRLDPGTKATILDDQLHSGPLGAPAAPAAQPAADQSEQFQKTAEAANIARGAIEAATAAAVTLAGAAGAVKLAWADVGNIFSGLIDPINNINAEFLKALEIATQLAAKLLEAAQNAATIKVPASGDGGGSAPFARGGMVWGAGTGTSDSILARLSSGEYVIRAAAVKHFGAGIFHMLNSLRMPKFNTGGLVDSLAALAPPGLARPGFGGAAPARAQARTPITLVVNGQRIGGLSGSDDAVASITRVAVSRQLASGGRKPSWMK